MFRNATGKLGKGPFFVIKGFITSKRQKQSKKYLADNETQCKLWGEASTDKGVICKKSTKEFPYLAIPHMIVRIE